MKCTKCNVDVAEGSKFCSECGASIEHQEAQTIAPEDSQEVVYGRWYHTGWVWFWFVFFTPVGVYGLVKRFVPEENQKWAWIALVLLVVAAIADGPKNKSGYRSSTGYWLEKETLYCKSEKQFDEQMSYLAQGVMSYAPGCRSTVKNMDVILLETKVFSGKSKVRVKSTNEVYWVNAESVNR